MDLILFILITGMVLYFLTKIVLFLLRPFFLARFIEKIEQLYARTQAILGKDLEQAMEDLKRWHKNETSTKILYSERDLEARIRAAQAAEEHNKDVHDKFIRLQERYIHNSQKLADSILIYRRYLEIKLRQNQEATVLSSGLMLGVTTSSKFESSARETMITLQEIERKIDILLKDEKIN